jgi:3-methyladenine DNA glycosylase AlkD
MHATTVLKLLEDTYQVTPQMLKHHVPNRKPFYGIPIPKLNDLAKVISKSDSIVFLESNDCSIYELEILQANVIGHLKDIDQAMFYFKKFATIAKEWSTVDTLCQRFVIAKKYPSQMFTLLESYAAIQDEYIQRMVAVMILCHYLNDTYIDQALQLLITLKHEGYYTKMAVAWALATMMIHYSDKVIPLFESNSLDPWTHQKAIQKTVESFRVSDALKSKMKSLRR